MRYFLPLVAILLGSTTTHAKLQSVNFYDSNSSSHTLVETCTEPPVVPITCTETQDCIDRFGEPDVPHDSICLDEPENEFDHKCVCPRGDWFLECEQNKCFPYSETITGSTCSNSEHCIKLGTGWDDPLDLVECVPRTENSKVGSCFCNNATAVHDYRNDTCIKKVDERGAECAINEQCHGLGYAECAHDQLTDQYKCDCIGGADASYYDGDICYKLAENVGEPCEVQQQCRKLQGDLNAAVCLDFNTTVKTCQCNATDGLEVNNQCWLFIDYDNIPCTHDEQCWPSTYCIREEGAVTKYCRCAEGYVDVLNSTNIDCRENVTVNGGLCEYPVQCFAGMGPYSDCFAGSCRCNDGFGYHNDNGAVNKCFPPKCYNQPCTSNGECATCVGANSLCRNTTTTRTCGCVDTAIDSEDGKCYLPKRVGDSCYTQAECTVPIKGHVECDMSSKRCVCEVDYVSDLGGTMCRSGSERVQFSLVFVVVMIAVSKLF